MKWIEVKMRELGVLSNPNYKIAFMLDSKAMITVFTEQYGVVGIVTSLNVRAIFYAHNKCPFVT